MPEKVGPLSHGIQSLKPGARDLVNMVLPVSAAGLTVARGYSLRSMIYPSTAQYRWRAVILRDVRLQDRGCR